MEEITFYEDERIQITGLRVVVDGVTYSTANIDGPSMFVRQVDRKNGIALVVAGLVCLLIAVVPVALLVGTLSTRTHFGALIFPLVFIILTVGLGLALLNAGRLSLLDARQTFTLVFNSHGSKIEALSSRDRAYVEKLVAAINQAISPGR